MNKVVTINLGGMAYQLEEGGYDALRAYLETAAVRLRGNPDRDEILSDIERAIADKFRALLASHKTVVETNEVAAILAEMGPIDADPGETPGADAKGAPGSAGKSGTAGEVPPIGPGRRPRRLYRIHEGAIISGVCNGIGAYFNVDPTFVRLAFALSVIFFGSGILVYIILTIVIPEALSPEEKAAASVPPHTAQEFIRRAKEGYYKAMKGIPDRQARREWQRRFRREMRGWRMSFDREMRMNRSWCRPIWQGNWTGQAPVGPEAGFTLPLLSLLHGVATVLWICALVSLFSSGTVFGVAPPATVPVWVVALFLCMAYGILVWPLKVARRGFYWGFGRASWSWSIVFLLDAMVWIALVIALLCLATHCSPELREAVRQAPSIAHQAAHDIKSWWKGQ